MPLDRKVRGLSAFDALADVHASDDLSGILRDMAKQVRAAHAAFIYEARAGTVPIAHVKYDPGDEDGYFWIGTSPVDAQSLSVVEPVPGVWLMIDRWADDMCLSLDPQAPLQAIIENHV